MSDDDSSGHASDDSDDSSNSVSASERSDEESDSKNSTSDMAATSTEGLSDSEACISGEDGGQTPPIPARWNPDHWCEHFPALQCRRPVLSLLPCAGFDSPGRALRAMGVKYTLAGLWETARAPSQVLRAMYAGHGDTSALHLGEDGDFTRFAMRDLPDADALVTGPPCPPFSCIGLRGGWEDPRGKSSSTPSRRSLNW